jgi:hypothetical protein
MGLAAAGFFAGAGLGAGLADLADLAEGFLAAGFDFVAMGVRALG